MMDEVVNVTALLNTLKRLWWVPIVTLGIGAGASYLLTERMPRIYQSSTLILVEPQKIPTNYVKPIVTTPIDSRVKTITQQVTSRSRIEAVINELEQFRKMRETIPMEDLVARINRNMKVEVRGTSTFKIYFEDPDPKLAAAVANAVAQLFIQENIAARSAEARKTTSFLEQQLQEKRAELEKQEALISEFNRIHMGQLPTQQGTNFQMLEGFRARLQTTMDAVSKEEDRKIILQTQLAEMPGAGVGNVQTAAQDLDQKKQRLVEARSQYTEQHPEVALLKRQIAQLEEQLARPDAARETPPPQPSTGGLSVREQQLRSQIADIELKIKDHAREADRLRGLITDYEQRVASTPRNEQLLLTMKRDYDILQQSYFDLLRNKTQAVMAESLEQERQGEQFIVIDRAVPPGRPFKPNVSQIVAFGCALGLMAGLGIALSFDLLRPRFRSEDELVAAFGIPVLASIPEIARSKDGSPAVRGKLWRFRAARFFSLLAAAGSLLNLRGPR